MINNFLNDRIEKNLDVLKFSKNNSKKIISLTIDKAFFNDMYFNNDIRNSEDLKEIFDVLKTIKNPVLYWFEIDDSKINAEKIRNLYNEHRIKKSNRAISSYKKHYDKNSKTLYVGKVKRGFWGRLITHLGYSTSVQTAGLQLFHWYNISEELPDLKLNYIVYEREMEDLISILELDLARELKPILGRY
jgi:RNA recognition motif-containing protein